MHDDIGHRLNHIPVFDDLAVFDAPDIDEGATTIIGMREDMVVNGKQIAIDHDVINHIDPLFGRQKFFRLRLLPFGSRPSWPLPNVSASVSASVSALVSAIPL